MITVIGVRFKRAGKVYYFNPGKLNIKVNDLVIVETMRGVECGTVVLGHKKINEAEFNKPIREVMRIANEDDLKKIEENAQKEKEAFDICMEKITARDMKMKLVDSEYTFDNNKIIFYFTADGRVDFRDLVKDLASVFRTRIELRQIGVRDEAKMVGGLGPCGRPACCAVFLGDFQPVSIKMAKEQNLSLSPTKISGLCGRLMCCLNYEHEYYQKVQARLPRINSIVRTKDGLEGVVMEANALTEKVKIKVKLKDGTVEVREVKLWDVKVISQAKPADDDIVIDEEIKSLLDD